MTTRASRAVLLALLALLHAQGAASSQEGIAVGIRGARTLLQRLKGEEHGQFHRLLPPGNGGGGGGNNNNNKTEQPTSSPTKGSSNSTPQPTSSPTKGSNNSTPQPTSSPTKGGGGGGSSSCTAATLTCKKDDDCCSGICTGSGNSKTCASVSGPSGPNGPTCSLDDPEISPETSPFTACDGTSGGSGCCDIRWIWYDNKTMCTHGGLLTCGSETFDAYQECGFEACCPNGSGGWVEPCYTALGACSCPLPGKTCGAVCP